MQLGSHLYLLATDQGYMNQPDLVWEKLNEACLLRHESLLIAYALYSQLLYVSELIMNSFNEDVGV